MDIGLLWYDDDAKRPLADKVRLAALRYEQKFGVQPNLCLVHPGALADKALIVDGITVEGLPSVLSHHFWLGISPDHKVSNTNAQDTST